MPGNMVNGFNVNGTVVKYDYNSLENKLELDNTLSIENAAADAKTVGDALSEIESSVGLSDDVKTALLNCFAHVAWVDEHGQGYYDDLYDSLYPAAELLYIDAVFNQGSTVVYNDASLDDLRSMLTVTAYYDDNTSEIVTNYTLSGNLIAGTNSITVTYNGKTDTFIVFVTERPSVSSISAVFDQGQTIIYESTSLDDLRPMLTVTAHYEDETTFIVTNYTLSGTLTVGISVITVSYSDKTTTFNVTVSEVVVPSGYQRVEWISPSTYNTSGITNTQYIETGVVPNLNTGIIARIAATSATPERNIFGIRQSSTAADNAMLIQVYSATTKFGFARWGTAIQTASYDNNFHDFELTASTAKVDDVSYELAAPISGQAITNVSFRLFAVYRNTGSTYTWQSGNPQKISYFKIMDGSTALREFIPCYRKSDGVIGMWDRVTSAFFTNGGSGTFVKGNDIMEGA